MEGGFARCYPTETRVDGIFWPHAAVLQLRDITRGQVEVNVRIRLGCRWSLIRRRRIGCGRFGISIQHLHDFVMGGTGKEFVSRVVFARTVNFGRNTALRPDISMPHTILKSFPKFLKSVNHNLLHSLFAEKLGAGSAPAKSEATGFSSSP